MTDRKKILLRIVLPILILFLTLLFGWWLFIPLALIYCFVSSRAYEILILGILLDNVYYFGESFLFDYFITIVATFSFILSVVLEYKVNIVKKI